LADHDTRIRRATSHTWEGGSLLNLVFGFLVVLILGGNALLIWQFHLAQVQAHRLTAINQQLVAVLRLQESIRSFNEKLEELVQTRNTAQFVPQANLLRESLLNYTGETLGSLARLQPDTLVEPGLAPTLEGIEITLPSQLDSITALALSGDWDSVHRRLSNQMRPLEIQISELVHLLDREVSDEVQRAAENMDSVQRRILVIVPVAAVFTFVVAALFGWATTRRLSELRLEERVAERTRIARELHDTLLQGFISASVQLHVALNQMPENLPSKAPLEHVLALVENVIEDGREAVRGFRTGQEGLRTGDGDLSDLKAAFSRIPQDLELPNQAAFRILEVGRPRLLAPLIRDEIYAVGREALVNAFRHSRGTAVEVEIEYSRSRFRVVVRDDGVGIDPQVLSTGRDGHWGLLGMRERADKIGATLKVLSEASAGTEIVLSIPARIAFDSENLP
jgi:signal transduction histidine kinase